MDAHFVLKLSHVGYSALLDALTERREPNALAHRNSQMRDIMLRHRKRDAASPEQAADVREAGLLVCEILSASSVPDTATAETLSGKTKKQCFRLKISHCVPAIRTAFPCLVRR